MTKIELFDQYADAYDDQFVINKYESVFYKDVISFGTEELYEILKKTGF